MDMLTIELEENGMQSGDACRGRVRIELPESLNAHSLSITLTASQLFRQPLSSNTAVRQILYAESIELAGPGLFDVGDYSFELTVPEPDRLDHPDPPELLLRFLAWVAPGSVGPVDWKLEARLERQLRKDVSTTLPLDVEMPADVGRTG